LSGKRKKAIIAVAVAVLCGLGAATWYALGPVPIVTPTAALLNGRTEGYADVHVERMSSDRTLRLHASVQLDPARQRTPGAYRYTIGATTAGSTTAGANAANAHVGVEQFNAPHVDYGAGNGGFRLPIVNIRFGGNKRIAHWKAVGGEVVVTVLTARQGRGNYQGSIELTNVELECHETGERCRIDSLILGPVKFGPYRL